MRNERTVRKLLLTFALLMSATLLYGGYQVHKEADRKADYEHSVKSKAEKVNSTLCREMGMKNILLTIQSAFCGHVLKNYDCTGSGHF